MGHTVESLFHKRIAQLCKESNIKHLSTEEDLEWPGKGRPYALSILKPHGPPRGDLFDGMDLPPEERQTCVALCAHIEEHAVCYIMTLLLYT